MRFFLIFLRMLSISIIEQAPRDSSTVSMGDAADPPGPNNSADVSKKVLIPLLLVPISGNLL